ncbi:DUF1330 domain-containing protein [Novosphingobium piscinae]|uniref:DUF1330 domain-containing protein n=1 Tax=Novosphingobium piscinae TaxID=1507448 RepID=A0A7X1FWP4_9SPHN|nr:DUF1330 domain-containing protein [Novosphingobium piscinae]MBC2667747.1 DUF1330 domain-containing protein [Novosphingobium piscinae]
MTAYILVYRETPVRDAAGMAEYSRLNRANAVDWQERYGIAPLAVYGQVEALEGTAPDGVVILRFPSLEQARAWYDSPAYREALALRVGAADWRVVLVEGLG